MQRIDDERVKHKLKTLRHEAQIYALSKTNKPKPVLKIKLASFLRKLANNLEASYAKESVNL